MPTSPRRTTKKTPAKRPSTTPRVTRKTEENRRAQLERGLRITVPNEAGDFDVYDLRIGDVSSSMVRELRRRTGYGFDTLMSLLVRDPDLDVVSTWVWLARRVEGENSLELDDVQITYRQLFEDGFEVEPVDEETVQSGEA